jgi:hypothetical protein
MNIQSKNVKIKEENILRFEQNFSIELPDDYKNFLLQYNGGIPDKLILSVEKYGDSILKELYGIVDEQIRDIPSNIKTYNNRIPSEFIPIGCDQLGNQIIMGVGTKYKHKIYFWWHEGESESEKPVYSNIYLISENFTSFIESLKDIPEDSKGNFEDFFKDENYNEIKKLLESGWDVNTPFENQLTPVQFITLRNNIEILKLLIGNKANLDGCIDHAITNNHFEVLELLLQSGADPNEINNAGRTPLHQAVIKSSYKSTDLLLKYNADPKIKDSYGHSLIDLAQKVKARGGKPEIEKIIEIIPE